MSAEQLSFADALRARDEALNRIGVVTSDSFRERAAEHILSVLRERGPSSGEVLVLACKAAGIVSSDDRHFGHPMRALVRRGLIECCGFVPRARGHGSAGGRLWRLRSA